MSTYEKHKQGLGSYEQEVLLDLDSKLTPPEAKPLTRGVPALEMADIIDNFYENGEAIRDCVATILVYRRTLLRDMCPRSVCTQSTTT